MLYEKVIADLISGKFEITIHAVVRMNERAVLKEDIMEVGRTVVFVKHQKFPSAPYRIRGKDLEGELMEVICDYGRGKAGEGTPYRPQIPRQFVLGATLLFIFAQ